MRVIYETTEDCNHCPFNTGRVCTKLGKYLFDIWFEQFVDGNANIQTIITIRANGEEGFCEEMAQNLKRENEQLKEEIRAYPINEEYAEEIMQQNQKLRIERNDLRIQNEKLKKKLECCEYSHFLNELDEIHEKVDKGDLSDVEGYTRYVTKDKELRCHGNCKHWKRWDYNKHIRAEIGICTHSCFKRVCRADNAACEEYDEV